jgi:hypothetical protein
LALTVGACLPAGWVGGWRLAVGGKDFFTFLLLNFYFLL